MTTKAIIAAGGLGTRLKTIRPKPLVMLNGKPLCVYCLEAFERCPVIDGIIVVTHEYHILDLEDVVNHYGFRKVERIVVGGATRCASVYNGLQEIGEQTDVVVVHDGARPLVKPRTIQEAVSACAAHGAVVVAVPVHSTIKKVDPRTLLVRETLSRDELWEAQTPQVFRKEILQRAYAQRGKDDPAPTDDASLVEQFEVPVKIIEGDYENIKITTNEDLMVAEALLSAQERELVA